MSYILDALRKADAARERDPARGIHAQPVVHRTAGADGLQARSIAWIVGAVALGVAIAAAAFVWLSPDDPPAPVTVPRAEAASEPQANASFSAAASARALDAEPAAQASTPSAASWSMPAPAIMPGPLPVEPSKTAAGPSGAKGAARSAEASASQPADERVLEFAELPADVQRELPTLAISGGVHSNNPLQRMLIVAGQVVNEGAELAPGLRLEEIRPKTAVLRYRGYRYSVNY